MRQKLIHKSFVYVFTRIVSVLNLSLLGTHKSGLVRKVVVRFNTAISRIVSE